MKPEHPQLASVLRGLKPYEHAHPVRLSDPSKNSILKLDCNEATTPPSRLVRKRLLEFVKREPLHWYPDPVSYDLRQALSQYTGFPMEFIAVFNGCDHALETLCRSYLEKGDEAVVFSPNYDNFRVFAESSGGKVISVFANSAFETDVERLEEALTPKTRIVYLSNPTNPTGVTYTTEEIRYILNLASSSLVVVDEAYFEFWGRTSLSLIREFPNLVITRSFSKAFALAGLRCGYIVSDPRNIIAMEKIRNGKNVNTLAQVAAIAALEDLPYLRDQIRRISDARGWFVQELIRMGIPVVATPANFVLIKAASPQEVKRALTAQNILVRDRSALPQMEGYLRITVGMKSDMKRCREALRFLSRSEPLSLRRFLFQTQRKDEKTDECYDQNP